MYNNLISLYKEFMISQDSEYIDALKEAEEKKLVGLHKEAIEVCEKILFSDPYCIEAYEEIGDNYLSMREFEKSVRALQRALYINPNSANAHYLLGFTYSAVNEWDSSIEELENADKIEPNHPEILRCLGWSIFHSGRKKQGLIILERASYMAQDDCLILCDLGVCYLNDRQFEKAEGIFNGVLNKDPENDKARECLKACTYFKRRIRQ
jgi:tetratricopeptide (TPR) repeat protein